MVNDTYTYFFEVCTQRFTVAKKEHRKVYPSILSKLRTSRKFVMGQILSNLESPAIQCENIMASVMIKKNHIFIQFW